MLRDLGRLLHVPALLALVVLPVALARGETPVAWALILTSGTAGAVAQLCYRLPVPQGLLRHRPSITVSASWLGIGLLGALPFWCSALWSPQGGATLAGFADPLNAVFESVSGFTGTGLSVASDPAALPESLQLWRSLSEWLGSLGVVVLALAVGRMSGDAYGELRSETRNERLLPTMRDTARRIWLIYLVYTAAVVLAMKLAGAGWWSAFNHGLTAISTGGFSIHRDSLGAEGLAVQVVGLTALVLGAQGFDDHHRLWTGRWRRLARTPALWLFAILLVLGPAALMTVSDLGWWDAVFLYGSAQSTGGLSTADPANLAPTAWWILIAAMSLGGSAGSTAGGIKQRRLLFFGHVLWHLLRHRRLFAGERSSLHAIPLFLLAYVLTLVGGSAAIAAIAGTGIAPAAFEMASALANCGLSIGLATPDAPWGVRLILCLGMILGRLEILPVAVLVAALVGAHRAESELERDVESD